MFIYLLTHERELLKNSNTGKLVTQVLPEYSNVITWKRKEPSLALLDKIASGGTALLYPGEDSDTLEDAPEYENYILLDGTWQEAQKMYNKSEYLKALPKIKIDQHQPSIYRLRRNQKQQGLCTAESVSVLLNSLGRGELASQLGSELEAFVAKK